MLQGKHVVLGVTGSIAAYKIAILASMLKKQKADVTVYGCTVKIRVSLRILGRP